MSSGGLPGPNTSGLTSARNAVSRYRYSRLDCCASDDCSETRERIESDEPPVEPMPCASKAIRGSRSPGPTGTEVLCCTVKLHSGAGVLGPPSLLGSDMSEMDKPESRPLPAVSGIVGAAAAAATL